MAGLRPTRLTSRRINRAEAQDKCRAIQPGTSSFLRAFPDVHRRFLGASPVTAGQTRSVATPVVASGE
jgi:hypothetical protein